MLACSKKEPAKAAAAGPAAPVPVGVVEVKSQPVTLVKELPGRVSALRVAEVRARVNGIVLKRLFEEGSDVKANQPLFRIDPAPYQATLESANAMVAKAEAQVASAKTLNERYAKLVETNAVSKQEYDNAVATLKTAEADVAASRAAVKSARINVGYTTVQSPIAGRIGRAEVTEGAYVQQSAATLMATVQQLDRVYVDMTWSSSEVLKLRRAIEQGKLTRQGTPTEARVVLILDDGTEYAEAGTLQFSDVSVDESTGSIALRAVVPNPKLELMPGMFVRARIEEGTQPNAILVPQRAITRDQNGRPTALVVDAANKVERRTLETDRAIGDSWLVTKGLAAGEKVIVEGLQKVRPGALVAPGPAGPSGQVAASGAGSAAAPAAPTPTAPTAPAAGSAAGSAAR